MSIIIIIIIIDDGDDNDNNNNNMELCCPDLMAIFYWMFRCHLCDSMLAFKKKKLRISLNWPEYESNKIISASIINFTNKIWAING